jgi:hypothetical protein
MKIKALKSKKIKIIALVLIIGLNWFGLSAIGGTLANFSDTEASAGNTYTAATLGFSVQSSGFSPKVTPTQNATATVSLTNDGVLDFVYNLKVENVTGTLCGSLELKDDLTGEFHPLTSFVSATTTFSATSSLLFTAKLTGEDASLRAKRCVFTFVFDGVQLEGAGFSDREEVEETIIAGQWGPNVVINKVYYDPDPNHSTGSAPHANEWIELYNASDLDIDIAGWTIADNDATDTIPVAGPQIVPAKGHALITGSSTTWHYWEIPADVLKIVLADGRIGDGLANSADMLVLRDSDNNLIDQMNWGDPDPDWPHYNAGVWDPGAHGVAKGHMLGRVPSGYDTDQPSDFKDLSLPTVAVTYPNGGEVFYVGRTYTLRWTAQNANGTSTDLKIDIYYSRDSGATWAKIASSTENDGVYDWRVPLFINDYYVPSHKGRIKVAAIGPENFMAQAWDMSDRDFCPPIDYGLLTPEELEMLKKIESGEISVDGPIPEPPVIESSFAPEISSTLETSVLNVGTTTAVADSVDSAIDLATTTAAVEATTSTIESAIEAATSTEATTSTIEEAAAAPDTATTTIETAITTIDTTITFEAATTTVISDNIDNELTVVEPANQEEILAASIAGEEPAIQQDAVIPSDNNSEDKNAVSGNNDGTGGNNNESGAAPATSSE